jgi:hypothetical protein
MKNILFLLSILVIIGILWLLSGFWSFSPERYVGPQIQEKTYMPKERIDLEHLKKEFVPAYEF